MFFNTIERKLKKSYQSINKEFANKIFPNGLSEYVYVGILLNNLFGNKIELAKLIQLYASIYTFYNLETGNIFTTYNYAEKKCVNILDEPDLKKLIAVIMMNTAEKKNLNENPITQLKLYENYVNEYLNIVDEIDNHLDIFSTKNNDKIGTINNPILVNGINGIRKYIEESPNYGAIKYNRTSTIYLTDNSTNISYAVDEYTIYDKDDIQIDKIWFNFYGKDNCTIYSKKEFNTNSSIDETDFNYINQLYEHCSNTLQELLENIVKSHYKYIDENNITQYDYNSFMRLILYLCKLHLFDGSKYNKFELKNINKCFYEMCINYHEFQIEKLYNIPKSSIEELFRAINIFDSYSKVCDKLFMESDKTLLSFIGPPCMILHYYRKNSENDIVKAGDNIIPDDNDEYNKIFLNVVNLVAKSDFYDKIDNITKEYLSHIIK